MYFCCIGNIKQKLQLNFPNSFFMQTNTTYSLLLFSPLFNNGDSESFSWQIIRKFVIKGTCLDLKKSTNALFNSIKRAQAMVRPRKNFTLVIMFSVRKLFFELIASAIESALFSDLFDVKEWSIHDVTSEFLAKVKSCLIKWRHSICDSFRYLAQ